MNTLVSYIVGGVRSFLKKDIKTLYPVKIDQTSSFESPNFIGRYCVMIGTTVGKYTYFGNDCEFYYSKIGRYTAISNDVKLIRGAHPTDTIVSVCPMFFQHLTCFGKGFVNQTLFKLNEICKNGALLNIGNDVWIGSHVRILEGVEIGNGAIIGAGSVVTKDVPPYSICVGVPAKVIKYRFDESEISLLQKSKWWEWEQDKILSNINQFQNIKLFAEKFGKV